MQNNVSREMSSIKKKSKVQYFDLYQIPNYKSNDWSNDPLNGWSFDLLFVHLNNHPSIYQSTDQLINWSFRCVKYNA